MDRTEYENLYNNEDSYWWFIGNRAMLRSFFLKHYASDVNVGKKHTVRILDVGSGTGRNLQLLKEFGDAEGCDVSNEAIDFCRRRGLVIKKSDVLKLDYDSETFDVVTTMGVLYHKAVVDDVLAMRQIYRVLKPGGRFFMMDSAMMSLFGKHDIAFQGVRRYSCHELQAKLESAGFIVERIYYVNTLLFPVVWLSRKLGQLSKKKPVSEVEKIYPFANYMLLKLYLFELKWLRRLRIPFGVNIVAVGRK
jgi:SAM-dependent methyltransferase